MQENTQKNTGPAQSEDLAMKAAASYFGEELLPWLGIKEKIIRNAPTEVIKVEARHLYEDFLYEMENGCWYHFEFESDAVTEEDLRRFREYEASTARQYNIPVITYVICSSKVRKLKDSMREGINTYKVRVIRLKNESADKVLENLSESPKRKIKRKDMIPLLFTPLMSGEQKMQWRVIESIRILKKAEKMFSEQEIRKMEAILYILAAKFLSEDELKLIKEEIAMTKLGQMIWDDAVNKGREEWERIGREEGEKRYSRLILLLNQDNRTDLIVKAASDPEYRNALYREYHI